MQRLENQFENARSGYKHKNETLQVKYRNLKACDQQSATLIERKTKEMKKLQDAVNNCRCVSSQRYRMSHHHEAPASSGLALPQGD